MLAHKYYSVYKIGHIAYIECSSAETVAVNYYPTANSQRR